MTLFESIKSKNIDELAEWFYNLDTDGEAAWFVWYDQTYCQNCPSVTTCFKDGTEHEVAWCELYGNCKFFQHLNNNPDELQTIKLWLESKINKNE
jgi:hypothetical protein